MGDASQYRVTLSGHGLDTITFEASTTRSIVKSAAAAGIVLTTGCLQGRCAICRAQLRKGQVGALRKVSVNANADPTQRYDGCVLPCSIVPLSDVDISPLSPWKVAGRDR